MKVLNLHMSKQNNTWTTLSGKKRREEWDNSWSVGSSSQPSVRTHCTR